MYAESSWLASREALGASDDFERFEQIAMGWLPLPHDVTLGARGNYAWSSSGTPFFLRPYVTFGASPRCVSRATRCASVEVEAALAISRPLERCRFRRRRHDANQPRDNFSATQSVASGGAGFRYELASKFGLNVGIDVAHSPGTTAVYFQVGNAWFRP